MDNGYSCICDRGWVLDESTIGKPHCVDNRKGTCWNKMVEPRDEGGEAPQCEANFPFTTLKAECCCAANQLAAAWGSPCQKYMSPLPVLSLYSVSVLTPVFSSFQV